MGTGFSTCKGVSSTTIRTADAPVDSKDQRKFCVSVKSAWGETRLFKRGADAKVVPIDPKQSKIINIKFHQHPSHTRGDSRMPEVDSFNMAMPQRSRPKSAHVRNYNGGSNYVREALDNSITSRTYKTPRIEDIDERDSEFSDDSDLLSIPDETLFSPKTKAQNLVKAEVALTNAKQQNNADDEVDSEDWWGTLCPLESEMNSPRSHGGSFLSRRFYDNNNVAKKASERSISSVILLTPIESPTHHLSTNNLSAVSSVSPTTFSATASPPISNSVTAKDDHAPTTTSTSMSTSPPSAPPCLTTNTECSDSIQPNSSTPQLTSFRKQVTHLEEYVYSETVILSKKPDTTLADFHDLVTSTRQDFLRAVTEAKEITGQTPRSLEFTDLSLLQNLESSLAEALYTAKDQITPSAASTFVLSHLSSLEVLCDNGSSNAHNSIISLATSPAKSCMANTDGERNNGLMFRTLDKVSVDTVDTPSPRTLMVSVAQGVENSLHPVNTGIKILQTVSERTEVSGFLGRELSMDTSPQISGTDILPSTMSTTTRARTCVRRPHTDLSVGSDGEIKAKRQEMKGIRSRPDSGIAVSSATFSSSEGDREEELEVTSDADWVTCSLGMLQQILAIRTEDYDSMKNLVKAITKNCTSDQLKAHALYRWLSSQHLGYYRYAVAARSSVPTTRLKQLAEGKLTYATLYQEMSRYAGLRCEKIEGYVKGKDYKPGMSIQCAANQHTWNAVSLNGHYALLDAEFGSLPFKFFVEHYFMTPPDEFRLSHFPKDKKWLLMTQGISINDFDNTLKTWPSMFAFNIRPLNMHSVLRTYDGRLSITVLLSNVAVTPWLDYEGPGPHIDSDTLAFNIDQEIRNVDSAETFHMTLTQEGIYYFTLMVHDVEEDKDIPALQYRIEYKDELL